MAARMPIMMITVLLPDYKHRGTQGSCDAHRKRYPASRFGESLEGKRCLCLVLHLLTIRRRGASAPSRVSSALVISRGKRFESARGLSRNLHKQAEFSLQGKAVPFPLRPGMPRGGSRTAPMAPEIHTHERLCQTSCSRTAPSCCIT